MLGAHIADIVEAYHRYRPTAGDLAYTAASGLRRGAAYVLDVPLAPRSVTPVEQPVFDHEKFHESSVRLWGNLSEKARLLRSQDPSHEDIRTALVVGGGGMAGVVTAGMLEEFREQGILHIFDRIVGVSAGAANVACAVGASEQAGVSTYTDILAPSREFIRHGLSWPGGMNLEVLGDFLTSDNGIKKERLKAARPEVLIGVVDRHGEQVLFDIKEQPPGQEGNLVTTSCAAPYTFNEPGFVGDQPYADGFLMGYPTKPLIQAGYNNVVVMTSQPLSEILGNEGFGIAKSLWIRRHMKGYPKAIVDAVLGLGETIKHSLDPLFTSGVNFTILSPQSHMADILTTDRPTLVQAGLEGRRVARQQLALLAA